MHEARTFLHDLALVCCVAAVVAVIFRRLHQPVVLGYLLAGMIIGPHVPIPLSVDADRVHDLSELGVILVMFSIGLEFSVARFVRVLPNAGLTGLIQLGGMLWLGYSVGTLFGWTWQESLFAGGIVCISSTMIVARAFADHKVESRLSELVFGVLIVEDLAAVLLITLMTTIATGSGLSAGALATTSAQLILFVVALVAIGFLVVPRAIRGVSRLRSQETLLVASVGLCFGLALLAEEFGYSVALGAFVAGSLIAESGRQKQVEHLIVPLRDLFAAVFFVSVGMMVDPAIVLQHWPVVLALTALVIFGQMTFVTVGSFLSGMGVTTSIRAGMSLSQIGEFSFIIAGIGVAGGVVGDFLYPVAVAVAVITTFTTPWLVRFSEPVALWVERRLPHPVQTFATLYGTWLETLRARARSARDRRRSPVRRRVVVLILDGAVLAGLVVGVAVAWPLLLNLSGTHLGLSPALSSALIVASAGLLSLPFALGVVRCARDLGIALANVVLPPREADGDDAADSPRKAMILTIQLAILLLVGIPLLAVTQPFLPLFYGLPILLVMVGALAVGLWRSTTNLEVHVRAGAELLIELLGRQRAEEESATHEVESRLPGLGHVTPLHIESDSPAVGKSLADLNLRGITGVTVIAIVRGDGGVATPTGRETLAPGDVLALSGTEEAAEAARALVLGEEIESPPAPADGEDIAPATALRPDDDATAE